MKKRNLLQPTQLNHIYYFIHARQIHYTIKKFINAKIYTYTFVIICSLLYGEHNNNKSHNVAYFAIMNNT